MARASADPYGDFVVRVMNATRIALGQNGTMSADEFHIVESVRAHLIDLDPAAVNVAKANIRIYHHPDKED